LFLRLPSCCLHAPATPAIRTLSLHDALPIYRAACRAGWPLDVLLRKVSEIVGSNPSANEDVLTDDLSEHSRGDAGQSLHHHAQSAPDTQCPERSTYRRAEPSARRLRVG